MTLEEKKQIYLDRFPAIIGKRMAEQFDEDECVSSIIETSKLITFIFGFSDWSITNEGEKFWDDIHSLYYNNDVIEHQQILDIFHKHNIKP